MSKFSFRIGYTDAISIAIGIKSMKEVESVLFKKEDKLRFFKLNLFREGINALHNNAQKAKEAIIQKQDGFSPITSQILTVIVNQQIVDYTTVLTLLDNLFPELKPQTEQMNDRIKDSIPKNPNLDLK